MGLRRGSISSEMGNGRQREDEARIVVGFPGLAALYALHEDWEVVNAVNGTRICT